MLRGVLPKFIVGDSRPLCRFESPRLKYCMHIRLSCVGANLSSEFKNLDSDLPVTTLFAC
ncbi:hypothetical protein EYF80_010518 [Liparis tanakae]|uniref:Uncharacterized protein n=1 Tax=Liparis tanakae TaxID=230148 RepID=A0A4Z2IQ28_9TELE|nr:hypothetical protein EYF80_010518 [Liparis tanakae]